MTIHGQFFGNNRNPCAMLGLFPAVRQTDGEHGCLKPSRMSLHNGDVAGSNQATNRAHINLGELMISEQQLRQ